MLDLHKFCEVNLGKNWELKITPHYIYISFIYKTKNDISVRPEFKGLDVEDIYDQITGRLSDLKENGAII